MDSIGVVIPAYKPAVERLAEYVLALAEAIDPATIRIELDAPDAATVDRLQSVPAVVNTVSDRRGKGAAITAGFEALETDILAFADADGSTPPAELSSVLDALTQGSVDIAVGSRRHPGSTVTSHQTILRRYMGDTFAWLARRLLRINLHDYQCGAKALTTDAWEQVRSHLYASGFAWDIELLAVAGALDLSVAEVPITWHDQPGSTVSPIWTPISMGQSLIVAHHRAEQLRDSRLHAALADRRDGPTALVDREQNS